MIVHREIAQEARGFSILMRIEFSAAEMGIIERLELKHSRVFTHDSSSRITRIFRSGPDKTICAQVGKAKDRWSAILGRTSGFIIIDSIINSVKLILNMIVNLARLIVGTRYRLKDLINGVTLRFNRIENLKEFELFSLVSLVAISKAIKYGEIVGSKSSLDYEEILSEIKGVDFSHEDQASEDEKIVDMILEKYAA